MQAWACSLKLAYFLASISGIWRIIAIELVEDRETKKSFPSERRLGYQIYKEALKQGLLLRPLGDVLYFNPPLIISPEEMEEAVAVCSACVRKVLG